MYHRRSYNSRIDPSTLPIGALLLQLNHDGFPKIVQVGGNAVDCSPVESTIPDPKELILLHYLSFRRPSSSDVRTFSKVLQQSSPSTHLGAAYGVQIVLVLVGERRAASRGLVQGGCFGRVLIQRVAAPPLHHHFPLALACRNSFLLAPFACGQPNTFQVKRMHALPAQVAVGPWSYEIWSTRHTYICQLA